MMLHEAIKLSKETGKPFRSKGSRNVWYIYDDNKQTLPRICYYNENKTTNVVVSFCYADTFLKDDWEIEEQTLEFTRSDIDKIIYNELCRVERFNVREKTNDILSKLGFKE